MDEIVEQLSKLSINLDSASAVEIADKIVTYKYVTWFCLFGLVGFIIVLALVLLFKFAQTGYLKEQEKLEKRAAYLKNLDNIGAD